VNRLPEEKPLEVVRNEIRSDAESARLGAPPRPARRPPKATSNTARAVALRSEYSISELSQAHFTCFLEQAFQALLRRPPDPAGFEAQMRLLAEGRSKIEILGNLRWSAEGRNIGVRVPWLLPRYILAKSMRIPVLGYLIEWLVCLGGLPRIVRHQRAADTYNSARHDEVLAACRRLQLELETARADIARLGTDDEQLGVRLDDLRASLSHANAEIERTAADARELRHLVLSMNHWLASLRQNLSALELAEADQARHADALHADIALRVMAADAARPARLDGWAAQVASLLPAGAQVLDLCSGDDWLARLVGNGIEATGIDTSAEVGARARATGLSITVAEPSEVLARTADRSLHGLTALDTGSLLCDLPANSLLAAVRRVLRPGGLVVLGSGREPASIAWRLQGRADVQVDAELIGQMLLAGGFVEVQSLPASDGAVCMVARSGSLPA
jgi:SAM-dependent methyltransferase